MMKKVVLALIPLLVLSIAIFGQTGKKTRPRVVTTPTPVPRSAPVLINDDGVGVPEKRTPVLRDNTGGLPRTVPTPPPLVVNSDDDDEVIRIDTNFVTLPVTVLDRDGRFVSGLRQNDFRIYENGIEQKVEYFASVEKPFTVVLMIDVSPSTQYKIDEIRNAAITFVNQLRVNDQVMVVSFDQNYRVLTRPTNSRTRLYSAIRQAQFGSGTSLYDAVNRTIDSELRQLEGRKAIVLFTDGVDTTSNRANYESTVRKAEEADALIYPIRYDTSKQYSQSGGNTRNQPRRRGTGSIFGDILVGIITGTNGTININSGEAGQSTEEYARGKEYLQDLARLTGGRIFEADTTSNLDAAFRSIAEELRRQYSLGYYPEKVGDAGTRKSIRVRVKRANLVVRTKRSYIVGQS